MNESNSARICETCNTPIPLKRIQAVPDATQCVRCLERAGDVTPIRRFDEYTDNGEECHEQYFKSNPYIEEAIQRLKTGFNIADFAFAEG